MSRALKWIYVLLSFVILYVINASKQEEEKRILDIILDNKTYDNSIRPSGEDLANDPDGPLVVTINVFIKSIGDIDDQKMQYSLQVTFRQNWRDNRLVYKHMMNTNESKTKLPLKYLSLRDLSKIWTPDLFFSNEEESHFHEIMTPNNLLRITPDGGISYSTRISLTLSCPMNLKYFPFDKQICNVRMVSNSYSTDDIVFKWMDKNPIQLVKNIFLPRFNFSRHNTSVFNITTKTGTYSGLQLTLDFKREYGYYIIQCYMPCALLVIISFLSFWLDEIPTDARLSLIVSNLITLALLIVAINTTLPTVSYIKAIDVFTGICLLFMIAIVFQYAFSALAAFKEERLRQHQENHNSLQVSKSQDIKTLNQLSLKLNKNDMNTAGRWTKFRKWRHRLLPTDQSTSKQIDSISKFLFPFLFTAFITLYWLFLPNED